MMRKDIIDSERKTPAENMQTFVHTVCGEFTVAMVFYLFFTTLFSSQGAQLDIRMCWSFLALFVITTAVQFVFFTPTIIKRMSYPARLAGFGICLYAVLTLAAVSMRWFPVGILGNWALFTAIFLVSLAAAVAIANYKVKRDERILNEKLDEYRRNAS